MLARKGEPGEQGMHLKLDLSTQDLAHLLGTTRQTASSLVNRLAREGILRRAGPGAFDILRPDLLEARSQAGGPLSAG